MDMLRTIVPALALLLLPAAALAEHSATVDVMVVQASKQDGPTDPRLEALKQKFSGDFAYKSFKLLSQQQSTVKEGATQVVPLAGGKSLAVTFQKMEKDGR